MSMSRPYVIGLTGNIATGKSTVTRMLAYLGATIIDADRLAHKTMRAGSRTNADIVSAFGSYVQRPDGEIDRQRLGRIVFGDPQALALLESLTHPAVLAETRCLIRETQTAVLCIEAIKLLESGLDAHCDAIWVVTSSRDQQKRRLVCDRGMSAQEACRRIDAQSDPALKVARANVHVTNTGTIDETWQQVIAAWNAIPGLPRVTDATPCPLAKPTCCPAGK